MYLKLLLGLAIFGVVPFAAKKGLEQVELGDYRQKLGEFLMNLPRPVMMGLMAIPEQLVMYSFHPAMPLIQRLSVSIAMFIIHFAWNGMVMKPEFSHNELVWILGTSYYAYRVLGVSKQAATALIAADAVMTLSLRGLA
jgi:hypothetical protein